MTIEIQRGKAFEVDRGGSKWPTGQGMIKGLAVIWNHWSKSWTKKLTRMDETDGIFTVEYPEEQLVLPEASRNMPILIYDDETGHEFCTSCFQCERICPPQVIHMTQARDPNTGKPVPAVTEFIIEYDACMGCGLCAEVCPFDSIKMDHTFELSTFDHPSLTVHKKDLMKPVSYYQSIAPTWWEAAKENAYKKLEGSKKRRTGSIGIAPQIVEKLGLEPTPHNPAPTKTASAPSLAPAEEVGAISNVRPGAVVAKKPAAEEGASTPTDKEAKLAAIRAQNATKKAEQAGETVAAATEAQPQDAKAARLAAIRAQNAARKAEQAGESAAAATEAQPQDAKAARLAAIRAQNAARKAEQAGETVAAAATEAQPQDAKAARLAAIRAQNATKKAEQAGESAAAATEAQPQDDKAARLAAIRAQNAAKKAEQAGERAAAATEAQPQDDKAARLAAIRAQNAAKKAEQEGGSEEAAQKPKTVSDDKAARLAAIRAKNAAKKADEGDTAAADAPAAATTPAPTTTTGKPPVTPSGGPTNAGRRVVKRV